MATRYWVGGAGNWSSTTKWSTTSGGTSGASVPTSVDDVIFDANSGGKFTATVDTAQTCASLSITPSATTGVLQLAITSSLTVTGAFSTSGTAGNNRIWIRGTTYGVRTNLVCNGTVSISDCDFRDIIVNGTASPISGTRIGNRGACAGITFDAPKTVYWSRGGGGNWSSDSWATSSGGAVNTDNFPLPQDTAVINNAGINATNAITFDSAVAYVPTIDMSTLTNSVSISTSSATTIYGSWISGSGTTLASTAALTFEGQGTKTITSAGKAFSGNITIDAYGGTVELADALNIGTRTLIVTNGTFDTKSYNVTAGSLTSSSSNVRAINLGSSTVTLSAQTNAIDFSTSTNLTLNAGTSSLISTNPNALLNLGSFTYYDLTFSSTSVGIREIVGSNIFNNLTLNATATGLSQLIFYSNNTINGAFVCAGSSATQRAFVRSGTLGTTRTITANAISANDCDFRDITIAGSAAGASPTRAGDCGGNSGINFPAPKTVYRVGTNNTWASGASWALSSGGTGDLNNLPLAQDTAVIDDVASTATLSFGSAYNVGSIDCSSRTSALTLSHNASFNIYGNYTSGSGITVSGTSTQTFSGRGTQTFTSAGKTITFPITVDSFSGTFQLGDALNSSNSLTLTSGTLDAVTYNVTCTTFTSNNSNIRTLKMGSGLWTLSGTGDCWFISTSNLAFLKGTADILLSNNTTTTRNFRGGVLSYNKLTIGGNTSTSTTSIQGNGNQFTELASTKTVAHTIDFGTTTQTFGKWTVTGTAGNVVTLTGTSTSLILAGSATSGIDYLAMGSIGFAATSPGEFYAGFNSTGTAAAPVFRTAPPVARTLYWVGGTGNWSDTARWSLSSGGAGGEAVPRSHDNVVFDSASNATAYTATVNAITSGNRCNQLTIAGPASGNVTLAGSTTLFIHGNVTLPATGLTRTYTGAFALSGSTTGKTFTTNGVTLASNISVFGVGCGWILGSALNNGSSSIFVTHGTFDTGNYNITNGAISSSNSNSRTISFGSSTLNLSASVSFDTSTNLTFNAGTSQINVSDANAGINGGSGQTFYNVSFTNTNIGTVTFSGTNTFNNLTIAGRTSAGLSNLSINANQTIIGTLTCSGSSATQRGFVRSNTIGTTRTLTVGTLAANDCDFRDITIAGTAAGTAPTRAGDCGGNSGITFPSSKTVYRVGTNGGWLGSNSWALTSGGTGSNDNYPLPQDTAVIDNNTAYTGVLNNGETYNVGSLDASTRTTGITLEYGNAPVNFYGNFTLGSGVTPQGAQSIVMSGRGTMTITSAGKTLSFGITVDTPTGTVQLNDTLNCQVSLGVTRGTFNANNYNVTISRLIANNTNTRTINMGSGLWTVTSALGATAIWNTAGAGITLNKGTANILLSDTSTTARAFDGGGLSYNKLTIGGATGVSTTTLTGNNTFTEIASTKTVAHTIALGSTSQRVGAFTVTGTAGNVVTITGNTSNLIYTGSGSITGLDYLNVQGRVYGSAGQITDVWYAGANSVNSGSLGWVFAAGVTPPPSANANFFLMFG